MPKEYRKHKPIDCDDAYEQGWGDCQSCIGRLPTAEKKGSWVCEIRHYKDTAGEFDYQYIYCSECGEQRRIGWSEAKYCPNCGARMTEA